MALSRTTGTGNGVQTDFSTPPYISKTHITVKVNGVPTTDFIWIGAQTIRFNSPPANGAPILIQRSTSPGARLVDYTTPGNLSEEDLDADSLQAFYLAQEAQDAVQDAIDAVAGSGNVPAPSSGDVGKFLRATGTGAYSWISLIKSMIADAGTKGLEILGLNTADEVLDAIGVTDEPLGQCRLVLNGSLLELRRHNGRHLFINGANELIPASPITLSASGIQGQTTSATAGRASNVVTITTSVPHGLVVGQQIFVYLNSSSTTGISVIGNFTVASVPNATTFTYASTGSDFGPTAMTTLSVLPIYFIYAYMNGATMTLEASPIQPTGDATYGHQIKSGDATRTLVGMAASVAGGVWEDTDLRRHVLSYYNRKGIKSVVGLSTNTNTTSATFVELAAAFRFTSLAWGDEEVRATANIIAFGNTLGQNEHAAIAMDHTIDEAFGQASAPSSSGYVVNLSHGWNGVPARGAHVFALHVAVAGGATLTFMGSALGNPRCTIRGSTMG